MVYKEKELKYYHMTTSSVKSMSLHHEINSQMLL